MYLRQARFMYNAGGSLTKNKTRKQKFKATVDCSYIYRNKLDNACFQDDITYGDFKYLQIFTKMNSV